MAEDERARAMTDSSATAWFESFAGTSSEGLRRALVARFGVDVGCEVHADAMAYAWENAESLAAMTNPLGYLYRVGQSAARRHNRWQRPIRLPAERHESGEPRREPGLVAALGRLGEDERVAVVLVHSFGWTYAEAGELLEVPSSTIRNHVHRGLVKLRGELGVDT